MSQWSVSAKGECRIVDEKDAMSVAQELFDKHGVQPKVEKIGDTEPAPANDVAPRAKPVTTIPAPESKPEVVYSDFGAGKQIVDAAAKSRIEAQQAALKASGVAVDASKQLYATGTRMAKIGYDNQQKRADEHNAKMLFADAAEALAARVRKEEREDIEVTAHDFGNAIKANGKVSAFNLRVTEQAMRGLCARLNSPSLRYLLGLRDRVAESRSEMLAIEALPAEEREPHHAERSKFLFESMRADRAKIADVIRHECMRSPETVLKLRTRQGVGDIFATVSPGFTPADAPEVVEQILKAKKLPKDARGSFAYDPISTDWELRANVWSPTPVQEQCVGEGFEAHSSFRARDNGTARLRGGGGGTFLICLNAGTYAAEDEGASRMHRTNVLVDFDTLLAASTKSTEAFIAAWGKNREHVLDVPTGLTIEDVIPGFWRHLLTDRRSELAGVLPGRSEHHVEKLTDAFWNERRDNDRVVRSDLAQGWTRYIQSQPTPVRREAESAIGDWIVSNRPVGCNLRDEV